MGKLTVIFVKIRRSEGIYIQYCLKLDRRYKPAFDERTQLNANNLQVGVARAVELFEADMIINRNPQILNGKNYSNKKR